MCVVCRMLAVYVKTGGLKVDEGNVRGLLQYVQQGVS